MTIDLAKYRLSLTLAIAPSLQEQIPVGDNGVRSGVLNEKILGFHELKSLLRLIDS